MILRIDDNKTIGDLQDKFEQCFPGLRIEFYNKSHNWEEPVSSKYKMPSECLIGQVRKIHTQGILEIKSWFETGKVEQDFKELFGLDIQIFKLKNNKWIQATESDKFTLAQLINKPVGNSKFFSDRAKY